MRKRKVSFYISIVSMTALVIVTFYSCFIGRSEENEVTAKPLALPVYTVNASDATTIKTYLGTIEGKVNVEVRPQVEGLLQEIYVDEGSFVEKGQKLFKVDASAYQELLNNSVANQNVAKAKLKNARLEMERLKPLVDNDVISEVRLRSAQSDYEVAKASLDQATAAVRSAEINQGFTIITAPVSGYIGRIPKRIGNLVGKGDKEPLTVLSDVQDVYVYFSMNESDFLYFSKLKVKEDSINGIPKSRNALSFPDAVLILADGEEYTNKGAVDAINGQVDRTTGAISLRASFPNADNMLRSGSTGTLKISEVKKNVIQIPQIATSELQDKTFVYVLDKEDKVRRRVVTIGGKSKDNYIIADGLAVGERVLLTGLDKITEGSTVTPIQQ
ncbi:efflux RND transporter periplasmic adaptor subunit [Sphingobacterium yanglingense]|uniref:Membrane fusion protein (Multidrug efflux system) n=1 Tax=Sphingobacterium yanglingense TaxID=1437280 RepID=A0A4R6WC16_9SPHI|nr:efflux RND transporter periplasmic adaptor subunit [Sphingobacterium yanglingense]TDQ75150.1 membrane fusion protein (multidrug efflux system) [Sphingobacterium yanglingense]